MGWNVSPPYKPQTGELTLKITVDIVPAVNNWFSPSFLRWCLFHMCASVLVRCSIHTPERAWKPSPWALCLPSMYTSMPALERPYTAPTPTLRFPQTGLSPHYYVTDIIHTFINGVTQWAKLQGRQRGEGGYVLQFAQCPKVEKLLCCCCGLYIERERVSGPLFEWSVRATSPSLAWPNVCPYLKFCQTSHVNPQATHPRPAEQKMYSFRTLLSI